MSRETKYKAFYRGLMWDVLSIEWSKGRVIFIDLGGNGTRQKSWWRASDGEDISLLQCTGETTKGGAEIFDGDIIDRKYGATVVWCDGGWYVVMDGDYHKRRLETFIKNRRKAGCPVEVAGNIYEGLFELVK